MWWQMLLMLYQNGKRNKAKNKYENREELHKKHPSRHTFRHIRVGHNNELKMK